MSLGAVLALGLCVAAPESTLERWQELGNAGVRAAKKGQLDVAETKLRAAVTVASEPGFATPYIDPYLTPLVTVLRKASRATAVRVELEQRTGPVKYADLALLALLQNADGDYAGAQKTLARLRQHVEATRPAANDPRQSSLDAYAAFVSFASGATDEGVRLFTAARKHRQKPLVSDPLEAALRGACEGYVARQEGQPERASTAFKQAAEQVEKIDPAHANARTLREAAGR